MNNDASYERADELGRELAGASHIGETVTILRRRAGMSDADLAARSGLTEKVLQELQAGIGLDRLGYDAWMALIRATQPRRPEWWDDGYEHDLSLGQDERAVSSEPASMRYWDRVETIRAQVREHYRHGGQ